MRETHLDYLDGWRGLAIVFLLIGHFTPILGINFGTVGVNLFFVLSGLLMGRLLFIQKTPIPIFYKRRISRIFPAVFFFLLAVVAVHLVSGREIKWTEVMAASLFINNYYSSYPAAPVGHFWSLCVEEHSYIVLSLVAIIARRKWASPIIVTGGLSALFALFGVYYWTQSSGPDLAFSQAIRSEVAAFGIFASVFLLLLLRDRRIPSVPMLAYPALIAFGLVMHWWSVPYPIRTVLGVGSFALAINLLAATPNIVQSALSFRPLRQLGIWSFSIYLWQQPFYGFVHRGIMPVWLALGLSLIAGVISFYLIERPVRNYLNRKWADTGNSGRSQGSCVKTHESDVHVHNFPLQITE